MAYVTEEGNHEGCRNGLSASRARLDKVAQGAAAVGAISWAISVAVSIQTFSRLIFSSILVRCPDFSDGKVT